MSTPFGPQLIGETAKTIDAMLRRLLQEPGLTEAQWVTMRLADVLEGSVDSDGLAAALAERAHFSDAADLVGVLTRRGLLEDGKLTRVGRELFADLQASIRRETAPIWDDLPDDDVAAAASVLNEVVARARRLLGADAVA